MRKSNTQHLGSVLREYVEALGMRRKLKEVSVLQKWEQILGKTVAARTQKIYLKNRVLYVYLNSSVVRAELLMLRDSIIHRLNEEAGEVIVEKIVLR